MIIRNLKFLREEVEKNLPIQLVISDVVYRPFDMGVFGSKGYSVTLFYYPSVMRGICFGSEIPSSEEIAKIVTSTSQRMITTI